MTPLSESSTNVLPPSSRRMPISSMDPNLYLYAAKGEGALHSEFESLLDSDTTPQENTALHIAAKYGRIECVTEIHMRCPSLLRRKNSNGDTALHLAAKNGFLNVVQYLIGQETQRILVSQQRGDIELGIRESSEEVAAETDDQESSWLMRMTNNKKDTALHVAVRNHFLFDGQKEAQYLEVVKLLREADPEYEYLANDAGETPMYIAAEENLDEFLEQLLQSDCSSSRFGGPSGRTALHAAVFNLNLDMTEKLVKKKPYLMREADEDGCTPLHFAVSAGSFEMVKLLLEYDRSVAYIPNNIGNSPIHLAVRKEDSSIFDELIRHCPDCHELVNDKGWNALHVAVSRTAEYELIKRILSDDILQGMTNEVDNDGNTPLHLAAKRTDFVAGDPIIRSRIADTSAMNKEHFTPLDAIPKEVDPFLAPGQKAIAKKLKRITPVRRRVRKVGRRYVKSDGAIEDKNKSEPNKESSSNDTNLVVATLIATVTFAAGFTLPGGFNSSIPYPGAAFLSQSVAFQAFVISNTIAMVLAVTAVFLHFWASLFQGFPIVLGKKLPQLAARLIVLAASSMVIAFMTGTYAVLPTSQALRVAACVVSSTFFLFQGFCLFLPYFGPAVASIADELFFIINTIQNWK